MSLSSSTNDFIRSFADSKHAFELLVIKVGYWRQVIFINGLLSMASIISDTLAFSWWFTPIVCISIWCDLHHNGVGQSKYLLATTVFDRVALGSIVYDVKKRNYNPQYGQKKAERHHLSASSLFTLHSSLFIIIIMVEW